MHPVKTRILRAGCLSLLALTFSNAQAASGKIAATVNGTPIHESVINMIVKEGVSRGQPNTPRLRQAVLQGRITTEVLVQAAKKRHLDRRANIKMQVKAAKQAVLATAYIRDYLKRHPVSEQAVQAEYDKIKAAKGDEQYHARHILLKTQAEAQKIIDQLNKGADFAKLAKKDSLDIGSKAQGGQLPWMTKSDLVAPFAKALRKLKKGEYTKTPVKTPFGWHVIQLEGTRPFHMPSLRNVKRNLRAAMERHESQRMIQKLRSEAKISYPDGTTGSK